MKFLASIFLLGTLVLAGFSQATKPKPAAAKPKLPAVTPAKKAGEKAEWDEAAAITDPTERIAALRKFVTAFPKSTKLSEAFALIATAEAGLGNEKLAANDADSAAKLFEAAATDAPKPIPDQLFTDTLSKFPANLYFRGLREVAFEIAKTLEGKADANAGQLLTIATFYISVENGSEARRVAENAIKIDANSSAGYQMLGLANRVDFKLEESAAAYAKALELEPDSLTARRGLAEMKRSLGKADEAVALYREILAKDDANLPARTGLILALFDADKRADAEAEMAKSLEANPGNVILLGGAAYWYAAHDEGAQAVALAQKAIDADPRFIWSHIALARGFMSQKKPADAERTLIAARRYGNFPTLEYEIASARLAAGFYREAAEELSKSFSVKDGVIHTALGGRVPGESKSFAELVGSERRASIFAPVAADNAENAAQLRALLEFEQELGAADPKADIVTKAADEFIAGDDKMKVHREIFAAATLLDKKIFLPKVLEITKAAPLSLDAGLDIPSAAAAVMASELYESRAVAAAGGQYVNVPEVPRATLSAVLRGRIEEINGWALYEMDDAAQAVVHLKRAAGVLPADSAWWRSSTWRLGTALVVSGKDAEALEAYIRFYKSTGSDASRYNAIEAVYRRVNGSSLGLEERIGPNPSPPETVAQKIEPTPELKNEPPSVVPMKSEPTPAAETSPATSPTIAVKTESTPVAELKPVPIPETVVKEPPPSELPSATPVTTPATAPIGPPPEGKAEPTADAVVEELPKTAETPAELPVATPTALADVPKTEPTRSPAPEETKPIQELTPEVQKTLDEKPKEIPAEVKPSATPKELFPSVIITIPSPETPKTTSKGTDAKAEPTPSPTPAEVKAAEDAKTTPTPAEIKAEEEIKLTPSPTPAEIKTAEETKAAPTPTPEEKAEEPKPTGTPATEKKTDDTPIVDASRPRVVETKPATPTEIKPCTLTVSEENITLRNGGGGLAVIVGRDGDENLDGLTATSTSPQDLNVRREMIEGVKARALFVVLSTSSKTGVFQVRFEMPCGKKEIMVKVQ